MFNYEMDATDSNIVDWYLVRIFVLTDRPDGAIEMLEEMASRPSFLGLGDLNLDPLYDGIRDDPRFQALSRRLESQIEW